MSHLFFQAITTALYVSGTMLGAEVSNGEQDRHHFYLQLIYSTGEKKSKHMK